MDLSDDSDTGEGGPLAEELNEDDLLGSSDEDDEVDVSNARGGRFSVRLSPESTGSQHQQSNLQTQSLDAEEEILDLALGDEEDGLELNPSDSSTPGISPVKLKVHTTVGTPPPDASGHVPPETIVSEKEEPGACGIQPEAEDNQESEEHEHEDDLPEEKKEILDDDDDEEKGERSRFLSERPPADGPKSSFSYIGSPQPIRSLGDHFRFGNQFRYGGSRLRNMRPHGMMQNHMRRGYRNGGPRMTNHHQIHPSPQHSLNNLSGRPDFRPPGPEIPVSQCSGQIFIDFNQPMQQQQQQQSQPQQPTSQQPPPAAVANPTPQTQTPPPAPVTPPAQRQAGVGIVRPQRQMSPVVRPRPIQNSPTKTLHPRPNIPRGAEERRNPFFPPVSQRPRNQFVPQQSFPPQPPPPHQQQHIQVRPPIFLPPNQQPVYLPQQPPNFIPPNPQPPPHMMGNFPYVGPNGPPGMMMMMRPGPGPMDFNHPFHGSSNSQGPPPSWHEASPPQFGGPPQFQGMPPGFFPPPQHQLPQMNPFPSEPHFNMQEQQGMNMLGYGPPPQFQVPRLPLPPHLYNKQPEQVITEPRRERYDYERERDREEERRINDEYRRYASKRGSESDEEEYRRSSTKLRRYEDSHYEERKSSKPSTSAPVDPRTAELAKIVGETKREMGIDDEYMAKMEEQKRKRDEIMRKKGRKKEEPLNSKKSSSIYVNPAAFKGDLSLLNNQIQQEMKVSSSRSNNPLHKPKPKTILRVTKNSKGEVIHMEKLLKVEKTKTTTKN